MKTIAKYIKDIVVQDPDTGGDVEVTLFKHQGGGIFGLDASYIDQVAGEDAQGNPVIIDPFDDHGGHCILQWPDEEIEENLAVYIGLK